MIANWLLTLLMFLFTVVVMCYKSHQIPSRGPGRRRRVPDFMEKRDTYTDHYGYFPEQLRVELLEEARNMFTFAYDSYMKYAFPADELDPIHCVGRGPDVENPSNININDVLGGYSLSLIDALDTLAVMGNVSEFKKAVKLVVDYVTFDTPNTVQVFESNIRVLGGLLSAHLLIDDEEKTFGNLKPDWYDGDLLSMAQNLADRMLMAFGTSPTGIPYPRVHLRDGVPPNGRKTSCTSGAGSLVLEFGVLGRLLGDPVYESFARKAVKSIWERRHNITGLFSTDIDVETGEWLSKLSGLGAGMDSFYEYLFKSYVMFGEKSDGHMFNEIYRTIKKFMRIGREECNQGVGPHPLYINVDMTFGTPINHWVDSLQAAIPGLQVLYGDVEEAVCHHAFYYGIWKRFGFLPERYNWKLKIPEVGFYPLRPEFIESTYLLFQATRNPFYLHVGRDIIFSLNNHTRAKCGYATVHNVVDKSLEDRQESFFLSETCKYIYLLFDFNNPLNARAAERFLFTTEGHIFPVGGKTRQKLWSHSNDDYKSVGDDVIMCRNPGQFSSFQLPLESRYIHQMFSEFGLD